MYFFFLNTIYRPCEIYLCNNLSVTSIQNTNTFLMVFYPNLLRLILCRLKLSLNFCYNNLSYAFPSF